jgi:hypothetical protein
MVELEQQEAGTRMLIYFPRTQPLTAEQKTVEFHTAMGPLQVKAAFDLMEMVYQGKLEL